MPLTDRVIPIRPMDRMPASAPRSVPPPLALYVHVPWCVRKCPYCDFNSHPQRGTLPEASFLAALIADLEAALPDIWGRRVVSLFIGGGTPSLLSPDAVDRLLAAVRARLSCAPGMEITLEANPGTVEAGRFAGFRAAGVNRLSLGVQSFSDSQLQALGRIHDGDGARRALAIAREVFDRVNVDLMYALPGQTPELALADVETALAFEPTHLSCYELTIEPNTAFAHQPPVLPDEDCAADIHDAIESRLLEAGWSHYEVSAYARPGHACMHNLNYWQFGDYLGIGPGAHSKLTLPDGIQRAQRHPHPDAYLSRAGKGDFLQSQHRVPAEELPVEFMLNALRLADGFAFDLFEARTGLPFATLQPDLERFAAQGLITLNDGRVRPTARGFRLANTMLSALLDRRYQEP